MTATRTAAVLLVLRVGLATATDSLTVAALNLGCRWKPDPFKTCDNCEVRFQQIVNAIRGTGAENFEGVPNFTNIDVLLVQELSAPHVNNFSNINDALRDRGFIYSSVESNGGRPSPTAGSPQCDDRPYTYQPFKTWLPHWQIGLGTFLDALSWFGFKTAVGPDNGGLVTWSKYPITDQFDARWCSHGFPAPAGYLVTLINQGGSPVVVVNTHMYPEFAFSEEFPITPSDIRTHQFTELAGLTNTLDGWLSGEYSIIVGGDFNEDMYGFANKQPEEDCTKIDPTAKTKFMQLGLDLSEACEGAGDFGKATWDHTNNDLARSRARNKHEVLDYLIQTHSSTGVTGVSEQTVVGVLKKKETDKWAGKNCSGPSGTPIGNPPWVEADFEALSDHNWISATFVAPAGGNMDQARTAFQSATATWQSEAATYGQVDTSCFLRSDCAQETSESWNGKELTCMDVDDLESDSTCQTCKSAGAQCQYIWVYGESECCEGMSCDMYGSYTYTYNRRRRWAGSWTRHYHHPTCS